MIWILRLFVYFVFLQQIKREKALKDELVHELENKELEMQLLLQKQKAVSSSIFVFHHRVSVCFLLHLLDTLKTSYWSQSRTVLNVGWHFLLGGRGRQKRCVLFEWKKLQNIYWGRVKRHGGQTSGSGVNYKDDLTFTEVDLLCTHWKRPGLEP